MEIETCKCLIYVASNNKIYELSVINKTIKEIFRLDEPIHFTSILQHDEKVIFATINNKIYCWNPHKNSTSNENGSNGTQPQSIIHYTFKTLANLKGLAISRNKILKIAVGNPFVKQKYSATNIVIFSNIKHSMWTMPVDEIFLKMIKSFKQKIDKDQILKEPLNFDDFICVIAENHKIFIEFVDFMKDFEQSSIESLAKHKKNSATKQTLINTKIKMDELIPSKEDQNFIMGRLFFTILMLHKEDFDVFLIDTKKKFLTNFYKHLLITKIPDLETNIKDLPSSHFLEKIKKNLQSYLNKAPSSEESLLMCKICKIKGKCIYNHTFMKCILTQEDIYLERFYLCKFCNSGLIDLESEFKLKNEDFDFHFNICPICLHLVKPICET